MDVRFGIVGDILLGYKKYPYSTNRGTCQEGFGRLLFLGEAHFFLPGLLEKGGMVPRQGIYLQVHTVSVCSTAKWQAFWSNMLKQVLEAGIPKMATDQPF